MKLLAAAFLALAILVTPAFAQDKPAACEFTLEAAAQGAEDLGGEIIALVDIEGDGVDQMLMASVEGYIQIWGVKDGCMVGVPVPLAKAKNKGIPA